MELKGKLPAQRADLRASQEELADSQLALTEAEFRIDSLREDSRQLRNQVSKWEDGRVERRLRLTQGQLITLRTSLRSAREELADAKRQLAQASAWGGDGN